MFKKYQIEILILACALIIGASIYVLGTRQNESNLPTSSDIPRDFRPIDTDKDIILGNPDAKLFIVEYGDLQCKFCREIHPTLKLHICKVSFCRVHYQLHKRSLQ